MNKVHQQRLLKLAKYLRLVPKERFDMWTWANDGFCTKKKPSEPHHHECKTAACALGWACTIPAFNKKGLQLKHNTDPWNPNQLTPKYKGFKGEDAGQEFFGLTEYESHTLFLGKDCTPKQKARQIEQLVRQYK